MYTLIVRQLPAAVETLKSQDPGSVGIWGAAVAERELIHNVLAHGTADRIVVLVPRAVSDGELEPMIEGLPHAERIYFVPHDRLDELRALEHVVVFAADSFVSLAAHIRSVYGTPRWVVSAVAHALSSYLAMKESVLLHLHEIYAHDSFICTSVAGAVAFRQMLANAQCHLRRRLGVDVSCPLQLPIIPLPTPTSSEQTVDRPAARGALGLQRDELVFLYLGRLSASRKADLGALLMAFREVRARVPNAVLVLAGDDANHESALLEESCQLLGVAHAVHVRPDPTAETKAQLYSAADVFVSLSDNVQETFGLTLLEAMEAGLPVVASDWSGYRDIVRDNETGFLIPSYWSDCVSSVGPTTALRINGEAFWVMAQTVAVSVPASVRAMVRLALEPDLRRAMGERGRTAARTTFNGATIVRQYEQVWTESLGSSHAATLDRLPAVPPMTCNYFRTFGHYASDVVSATSVFRVSEAGRQVLSRSLVVPGLDLDLPGFDAARLTAVLSLVGAHTSASVEDLLGSRPSECDLRHLQRLLKYGLIDVVAADGRG